MFERCKLMKIKQYYLIIIVLLLQNYCLSQSENKRAIQVSPYIGYSSPLGAYDDFSGNGFVFGLSVDKYLSNQFALGFDYNLQSNSFDSSFDYSVITNPFSVSETSNGNWSTSTFTFGPTYKIGSKKFTSEIYTKAGISYTKSPSYDAVLSSSDFSKSILSFPEQQRTSFGLTTGIRFNYQISDKLKLFLNPQLVYSSSKVEYCNCGLDNLDNPQLILDQEPIKESFSPAFLNVNAGLSFSLGGNKKIIDPGKEVIISDEIIRDEPIRLHIISHKKGERIKLEDNENIKFQWDVIGNSKIVKAYKISIYQTDFWGKHSDKKQLVIIENQKSKEYSFKPTKTSRLLDEEIYYHFEVVGLDVEGQEVTNIEWRDIQQLTPPSPPPSPCFEIIVSKVEIDCDDPAYDQTTGWINYTGSVTIDNISDYYCGNLGLDGFFDIPPPSGFVVWSNNTPGYNNSGGFMNGVARDAQSGNLINPSDWNWSYQSPISSLPIPSGSSATIPITLQFRTVPGVVNFAVFGRSVDLIESDGSNLDKDEIDDCICEPCESYETAPSVTINSITLDAINHPSHSVLNIDQQLFAGNGAINNLKAELVFFEEILPNDPTVDPDLFEMNPSNDFFKKHLCQICNAAIDGLGVFNGNALVNNQGASSPTTRTVRWFFTSPLNMASGVPSSLQIGVPKVNPLACCNREYKFTIRYTFENEDCKKCDVLVDYHYQ